MQKLTARLFLSMILAPAAALSAQSPARADTRIQKTFEQWSVDCVEKDKKRCSLSFGLVNAKTKRVVLGWTVAPAVTGKGNRAIIRTPNGTLLPSGITVKFATSKPTVIPFKTCGQLYCIGEVPFSDAWLSAFKSGSTFSVVFSTADGKEISREVNLKGFNDGFAYYTEQSDAQSSE